MKRAKILANISNLMVTVFLVILIPCTIFGTYSVVVNGREIKENTRFRKENDSLMTELRLEKRINKFHREIIESNN